MTLDEQLRRAIRESGHPLLTIAKQTGVAVSTLSEFVTGADMRLATASKVASFLGAELTFPRVVKVRVEKSRTEKPRQVTVRVTKPKKCPTT